MRIAVAIALVCLALPVLAADTPTTQPGEAAATQPAPGQYMYKGKRIASDTAKDMYRRYGKQVVKVEGRYYDVGRELLVPAFIAEKPPAPGTLGTLSYSSWFKWNEYPQPITEVGVGYIVIKKDGDSHVVKKGVFDVLSPQMSIKILTSKKYTTDDKFWAPIVYVKTETVGNETRQVWQEYAPVPEAEFYEALKAGLELQKYRYVEEPETPGVSAADRKIRGRRPFKVEASPVY